VWYLDFNFKIENAGITYIRLAKIHTLSIHPRCRVCFYVFNSSFRIVHISSELVIAFICSFGFNMSLMVSSKKQLPVV